MTKQQNVLDVRTPKQENEEIAEQLKIDYQINKNISNALTLEQKKEVLQILQSNNSVVLLVNSFIDKNNELGNNNRTFGKERSQAKQALTTQVEENNKLATDLSQLRAEFIAFRKTVALVIGDFHNYLTNNVSDRSEILLFTRNLTKIFQRPPQKPFQK
jgi:hypothetical protein